MISFGETRSINKVAILFLSCLTTITVGFTVSSPFPSLFFTKYHQRTFTASSLKVRANLKTNNDNDSDDGIVDVDFERVVDAYSDSSSRSSTASTAQGNKKFLQGDDDDDDENDKYTTEKKSALDVSLDSDPRWKDVRIPFCRGDEYIDGKLAFLVELDGVQYGIAVPHDHAVAVIVQETKIAQDGPREIAPTTNVEYVNPDLYEENEEYQELMEIMAAQIYEELGEDFVLRKTPKVLTISGDLDAITENWKRDILGQPATIDEFLEVGQLKDSSTDDDLSEFMDFMIQELGQEEFEKTMNEDPTEEDKELMELFKVPGMGGEGMEEVIKSIEDDLADNSGVQREAEKIGGMTDDVALKLISFEFKGKGKSYSLVKLLQPYVLVGRLESTSTEDNPEEDANIRFQLLSPDEELALVPKLEDICKEDLVKAGLTFGGVSKNIAV